MDQILSLGVLSTPLVPAQGVLSEKVPAVENAAAQEENWVPGNGWVSAAPSVP